MKHYPFLALLMLLCLTVAQSVLAQNSIEEKELKNFHKVNDKLYRGAQPRDTAFEKLAQLGIKTILNLRTEEDRSEKEESLVKSAGLRYFNVPVRNFTSPKPAQIKEILSIINDPANQPVFIHCKRGADRTGTVVAIYRVMHEDWTSENAIREARQLGMRWWLFGMRNFIRKYEAEHKEAKTRIAE